MSRSIATKTYKYDHIPIAILIKDVIEKSFDFLKSKQNKRLSL